MGDEANSVLQRLRRNRLVNAPSASDALLLEPCHELGTVTGSTTATDVNRDAFNTFEDDVQVLDLPGTLDRFAVHLKMKCFFRRMSVTQSAVVEFIARGRAWSLQFFVAPPEDSLLPNVREEIMTHVKELRSLTLKDSSVSGSGLHEGSWVIALGLLEGSAPIVHGVNARLVIPSTRTVREAEYELQFREQGLVDNPRRAEASEQSNSQPPVARSSRASFVSGSSSKEDIERKAIQAFENHDIDLTSYISRILSRLVSTLPASQDKLPSRSVELEFQHYPFENKANKLDQSKAGQLLAPPFPPFPSIFSSDASKMKGKGVEVSESQQKEARARACACDMLTNFDDCSEAFDGGSHIDSDGTLHAILEVQVIKRA